MSGFHPYQAVLRQQLEERQGSVELVLLEAAWDDEIKCESLHSDHGPCSIEVTHHLTDCVSSALICLVTAEYAERAKEADVECTACGQPCGDHIRLRPI